MTTLKRGKTQQKNNFPLGVLLTVSPWAGVKLSLHLSCVTKWASPKNRPDRCKSLLQTVVYPCPFNLSLSKSTAERVWLCHAYPWQRSATHERCPPQELHMVPLPPASLTTEGASLMLVLKWCIQGKDNFFFITIWVLPSIQTPLITVNGIENGSNKFKLVQAHCRGFKSICSTTWKPISNQPENQQTDIPC